MSTPSSPDFAAQRAAMVNGQLRPNRITHPAVLAAYAALPRESFAAPAFRHAAYADQQLPVSSSRKAFVPMVSAHLVQAVVSRFESLSGKTVLVAGAGSGVEATLLAQLGATVVALEDDATLASVATAQAVYAHAGGLTVVQGPLGSGYAAQAPYDVLFLGAPYQVIPSALLSQLKDGGTLVGVRLNAQGIAQALVATRHQGVLMEEILMETEGTPHPAFRAEEQFVF